MSSYSSAKTSSSDSYAGLVNRRPLHLTFGWSRLSPFARLSIAAAFVVVASVATFMQSPRPDALRPPRWVSSLAWWRYPLEWNAANRLPKIDCSLKAIHARPNSDSIWAVGNKGMVVNSRDGGTTWIKKGIEDSQLASGNIAQGPLASPPSHATRLSSFLDWLDLVPTANAQEKEPKEPNRSLPVSKPVPTPPRDANAYSGLQSERPPQTRKTGKKDVDTVASRPTPTPSRAVKDTSRRLTPEQVRAALKPAQSARAVSPSTQTRLTNPSASPSPSPTENPSPTPLPIPPPSPETEQLIAVYFVDDNSGEAVDAMGWRYTTTDGGNSWNQNLIDATFFREGIEKELPPLRSLQLPTKGREGPRYFAVNQSRGMFQIDNLNYQGRGFNELQDFIPYGVVFLPDSDMGWVVGSAGTVVRIRDKISDGPAQVETFKTQSPEDLHGVFFVDQNRGWVTGSKGAIFATNDSGTTWTRQSSDTTTQLNAVNFLPDGLHGWIAGNEGLILSTSDGGATWMHHTQVTATGGRYLRFPAPWYFLSMLLMGALLWRKPKEEEAPPEESVADVLVSDRPLEEATGDVLAFNAIACGLSRFLRNENTLPPLTIAITGEWGTGKSSLMNLLRADLRSYKFRPVWFNAWHHQKEEHILASLLENIKLQAVPRWWTTRGVKFRGRLLKIRGVRQWGPLVLLLFFIYLIAIYHYYADGGATAHLKIPLTPAEVIEVLPILAGVATFAGALWRGMTAFGVKPASLLAGVSRGVSIRGLEAQTSFRQKFAVEFNDVTRALGKRSLLIFIDDLDRCRPENVLETLEAVNFLTTSGECFVVIGMAREYVERCVGRAFNEVAQEMVDDLQDEQESAENIAKQKRIEFARQYLDKLINIEVPVPAPKQSQSLALLVASTRAFEESAPQSDWQRFRLSLVSFLARRWKLVPALLTTAGLIVLGYHLARGLAANGKSEIASAASAPVLTLPAPESEATLSPSPSAAPSPNETPLALSGQSASPTPIPTPDTERAVLVPGARALVSPGVLPLLALLALVWLASTILTRKSGLEVKDSARFVDALQIWHPLVYARLCTPRGTKRFMNFVRYLAMRQRRQKDSEPPLRRFLAALRRRLAGDRTSRDVLAQMDEESSRQIPDEVLVALAALQHFNPDCLADQPGPVSSPDQVWPRALSKDHPLWPLFDKARTRHEASFHNWGTLSQYRESFREMTANVQVR